ncbi:MAG: hypothetical protein HYX94_11325 [Chloroflexi bacterium]|nr:hypothetical protein [Chloroflexota bacterium]
MEKQEIIPGGGACLAPQMRSEAPAPVGAPLERLIRGAPLNQTRPAQRIHPGASDEWPAKDRAEAAID